VSEWPTVRLGDVSDLLAGYPFPSAEFTDNQADPRLLRGDNVGQGALRWDRAKRWPARGADGLDDYWLQRDDVILAMDRPWIEAGLKFAAVRDGDLPSLLVQRVSRIRGGSRLDRRYLKHVIASRSFTDYILSVQTGTTIPHISAKQILDFTFRLPPIDEQWRIAGILGALDDKIELNLRTGEALEGTAQALFKFWLLDSELDGFDQDGSLANAVDLLRDLVDPQLEPDTVFQHYSLPAYDAGREAISEPGAGIRSSKLAVPGGSILLSKLNPGIERVWLPDIKPDDRAICSTEFIVLRPRVGIGRAFVYEFLRSAPFRSTLTSLVTGTTGSHQRAHAEAILQVQLRLPGPSRAAQFERLVGPMLDRIAVARRESRTLVALRDALLPRLLNGEAGPSFGRGHAT